MGGVCTCLQTIFCFSENFSLRNKMKPRSNDTNGGGGGGGDSLPAPCMWQSITRVEATVFQNTSRCNEWGRAVDSIGDR